MGDRQIGEAIYAASGVLAVRRPIGDSQPSGSTWSHAPEGRALSEEAVMAFANVILEPIDLGRQPEIDEVETARAREYALLALLLARAPDAECIEPNRETSRRCNAARSRACGARAGSGRYEPENN